jgi:hypothetical protein
MPTLAAALPGASFLNAESTLAAEILEQCRLYIILLQPRNGPSLGGIVLILHDNSTPDF